jgi:hypothetical protein
MSSVGKEEVICFSEKRVQSRLNMRFALETMRTRTAFVRKIFNVDNNTSFRGDLFSRDNIVTDWAVARRKIDKHIPANSHPTIEGRPLLANRPVNTYYSNDCATIERMFSMGCGPRIYLEDH